jgi:hypothetical protein
MEIHLGRPNPLAGSDANAAAIHVFGSLQRNGGLRYLVQ